MGRCRWRSRHQRLANIWMWAGANRHDGAGVSRSSLHPATSSLPGEGVPPSGASPGTPRSQAREGASRAAARRRRRCEQRCYRFSLQNWVSFRHAKLSPPSLGKGSRWGWAKISFQPLPCPPPPPRGFSINVPDLLLPQQSQGWGMAGTRRGSGLGSPAPWGAAWPWGHPWAQGMGIVPGDHSALGLCCFQ